MKSVLFPKSFYFYFIYTVLMVKLNCINQKAHLINWDLQFYLYQIVFPLFSGFHFNGSIKLKKSKASSINWFYI